MPRQEHDADDRGQYSRWRDRDEEGRQSRWSEGGRGFDAPRDSGYGRSSSGPGIEREPGYRERERTGSWAGASDWQREGRRQDWDDESDRSPRFAGHREPVLRRDTDQPRYTESRGEMRPRERAWDWQENYNRTANWGPDRGRETSAEHERGYGDRGFSSRSSEDDRGYLPREEMRGRSFSGQSGWMGGSFEGPFTGRGPRGYQRSDERIKEDICELLTRHGQIDPSDVDIDVHHGEVILRGWVDGRSMKRLIEDVIEDIPGVRDIRNEIKVHQGAMGGGSHTYTTGGSSYQSMGGTSGRSTFERELGTSFGAGMGPSGGAGGMNFRSQIHEGMEVVGVDGDTVGSVKEVSSSSFLLERSMNRDVFVPFHAIQSMSGNRMSLNIRGSEINDQGWATPDLMGARSSNSSVR